MKLYAIGDAQDEFPLDAGEQSDSDKDGVGDNVIFLTPIRLNPTTRIWMV